MSAARITATREHEIACGHRVHKHESKCAHLHGHNYLFRLTCAADNALDELGRVVDFSVMKSTLCEWLEQEWDHRMLLDRLDPLATVLARLDNKVVLTPFNPTAEKMAEFVGTVVGPTVLPAGIRLVRVEVWETRKCSAAWSAE